MMKLLYCIILLLLLSLPTAAAEITAPEVPETAQERMPHNTHSFEDALAELLETGAELFLPELRDALWTNSVIVFIVMLCSFLLILTENTSQTASVAGAVMISSVMFQNADSMIRHASEMVLDICEYGKVLCPVLTTALAAQGGIAASTVLYTGTIAFISLLSTLVSRLIVPMVYLFLTFSVAYCALNEETMKQLADAVKGFLTWLLKTLLIVFTSYMSITGVVSGTTDAAALKTARVTISSVVPVVGGILSDASESVLVSMGMVKNAVGIYGILAVLAIFIGPFIKVGVQYLLLKVSAGLCSVFGDKNISSLVNQFSTAMGVLLGMVATGCMMVLISTVCFMKGIE